MLDGFVQDLRVAVRGLRRSPGFAAVALATLAVGIGATAAIFSVVDRVLLRPLAYRDPQRLYVVHEAEPRVSRIASRMPVNAVHFGEWRRAARSFESMALIDGYSANLTGSGDPERISIARVSPSLFPMLGVTPQLGRTFLDEEDQPGRDRVVLLNDRLWRTRFAGDPGIVGRTVMLDGQTYEVVGVLPRGFRFPNLSQLYAMSIAGDQPQAWKPFGLQDAERSPIGDYNYVCIAALRPDATRAAATADLNAIQAKIAAGLADKTELQAVLVPLKDQITGRARTGIELVFGAAALVLLIGCVNISNLLLSRATRWRLIRQMLAESVVLSTAGGLGGAWIAYAGVRALAASAPLDLPRVDELQVDLRILLMTLAASLMCGLVFGLAPAWRSAATDPQESLRGVRAVAAGAQTGRLRAVLVGIEVAFSALALSVGGLLLHSFVNTLRVNGGFDRDHVVAISLNLPDRRYPDIAERSAFIRELLRRSASLPGVVSAGVSNMLPLGGVGYNNVLHVEGRKESDAELLIADIRIVNPEYFPTMGIPVRSGQVFSETDQQRRLAVVSDRTARVLWPGEDPIGRRFRIGAADSAPIEVTGVVGDIHGVSLTNAPAMTVYVPYWQRSRPQVRLAVRTSLDPPAIGAALREVVRSIDPELPVPAPRSMAEVVDDSVAEQRFQMRLVLAFGAAAVLLASIGIFGVVSYSVLQRTAEIGIRMALGARPERIRAMVLAQNLRPVALGLLAGVAAGIATGRLLQATLFGVSALDPVTLSGVVLILTGVAGAAAYLPARRATQVDPIGALRAE
jgi:putative ABC transport system permease protein